MIRRVRGAILVAQTGETVTITVLDDAASRPATRTLRLTPLDLALIFAVFAMATPLLQAHNLFNDPDTLWHLHYGRELLRTGVFPWSDSDSFTAHGHPWIAKEWLSQVILASVHAAAGWTGLAVLVAFCVGLSMIIVGAPIARVATPLAAAFTLALLPLFWASHLLARPHVLAFPVVALWTLLLARAADRLESPHPAVALLMVLWANLHGGFTLGVVLAFGFAAESVLHAPADQRARLAKGWGLFLGLTLVAALCTPYGPQSLLVTGKILSLGRHLTAIQEWAPFSFQSENTAGFALLLGLAALLVWRPRFRLARIALILFTLFLALSHRRNLEFLALIMPSLIFPAVARRTGKLGLGSGAKIFDPRIAAALAAAVIGLVAITASRSPVPRSDIQPVAALDFARRHGLDRERVFNDYRFGGYLITQGIPTFIDGRAELFPLSVHDDYDAAQKPGPRQNRVLDAYGVGWILLSQDNPAVAALQQSPNWTSVYSDDIATILVRSGRDLSQQR